jgi:hypothetical protein
MNKINKYIAAFLTSVLSVACYAQPDDGPQAFVYGTYYYCDVATENDMDAVVEQYEKPVFDQWVADGKIIAWGYYSHFTGGQWRRLQYHISPTLQDAVNTQASIFGEIYANNPAAGRLRGQACESHDDYIWGQISGSTNTPDTAPKVSLSAYYVCDQTKQARANEIVEETLGPMYDKLVSEGKITNWGWMSHIVGGKYRKLATIMGDSHAAVLAARGETIAQLNESGAFDEFNSICGSHTDYLWNIVH